MYTSLKQDGDEDEETTLDSKLSTLDPSNNGKVIDSDAELEEREKNLEDY